MAKVKQALAEKFPKLPQRDVEWIEAVRQRPKQDNCIVYDVVDFALCQQGLIKDDTSEDDTCSEKSEDDSDNLRMKTSRPFGSPTIR